MLVSQQHTLSQNRDLCGIHGMPNLLLRMCIDTKWKFIIYTCICIILIFVWLLFHKIFIFEYCIAQILMGVNFDVC